MRRHRAPLFRGQLLRVVEDIGERFVKLADVVKERDSFDAAERVPVQPGGFAENQSVGCDASDVSASNGVVCIDRIE